MRVLQQADSELRKQLQSQIIRPGTKYKASQYVLQFTHAGRRFLFHTLTRELLEADLPQSCLSGQGWDSLIEKYFLVPTGIDECAFYQDVSSIMSSCREKKMHRLYTILPTTACNARCIYCYEGSIKRAAMTPETVRHTIQYITTRVRSLGGDDLQFAMEKDYRTGDEIEVLAESFAMLSSKTLQYISEVERVTAEKGRISAELSMATRIQADMLPSIFPAFPEKKEFDIYASMNPAKEVGGDFYDFFLIDDDHLGLVIADVSGKGVPAALFMMASKILIQNYAMMKGKPKEALEAANHQICQNNQEDMFVTVWLGILDLRTGLLTAANAGHEYPVLKMPGGKFELYKDQHGLVVGAMVRLKYKEYEIHLEKGSMIFLYTDGVAEATNANDELFGTDRLLDALNGSDNETPASALESVNRAVNAFVKDAPQFDDLTMLCLRYNG